MLFSTGPGFVYSCIDTPVLTADFCSTSDLILARWTPTFSFGISPTSTEMTLTIDDLVIRFNKTELSSNDSSLQILNALYKSDCPLLTVYFKFVPFSSPSRNI